MSELATIESARNGQNQVRSGVCTPGFKNITRSRNNKMPQLPQEPGSVENYTSYRDLRKAEEHEKLREKANNREKWKTITKVAVQRSDN